MKAQQTSPIWDTHYTWKCRKHIPVPLTCPAFFDQCPSCKQLRPSESLRPSRIPEEVKPEVVKPEVVKPVEVKPKHLTLVVPPPPAKAFSEDMSRGQAQRDLDETIIADLVAAAEKIKNSRVKAPTPPAPEPVVVSKRPKDIPVTAKSKKVYCPGPKCRKQARSTSPYCSKICSDRCLRLRKKFDRSILSEAEVKNLNVILAALNQWAGSSDDDKG